MATGTTLVIANKTYSSWSLRPWLAMTHFEVPFDEVVIPLKQDATSEEILTHSPAGKVPVLHHGDITVWESLAILDYLAEAFFDRPWWPMDPHAKAHARAISAEIHASFGALRSAMPMNLRKTYPGLRTNNSKRTYEFSDFPYPDDTADFPFAEDVRNYLEAYADHFNVRPLIQFQSEVTDVSRSTTDPDRLTVTVKSSEGEQSETKHEFDFVVVCNGVLHEPRIPHVEGVDEFNGQVLHSSSVKEDTYKKGDNVLVVGAGKSAFDCAARAAKQGVSPTLVFRKPHWMAPRYLPNGKPGDWLMISRFVSLLLPYYHAPHMYRLMQIQSWPVARLWWGLLSAIWPKDLSMPDDMKPGERLPFGLEQVGVGDDFYKAVNNGTAALKNASIKRFEPHAVELDTGEKLPADVVIFATGWTQTVNFLSPTLQQEIAPSGRLNLYRQILPITAPNIGFIGYASSIACQFTAEIGAHWLSEHFLGSLKLPSTEDMKRDIDRVYDWANRKLPSRGPETFIGPYLVHYMNDLLEDMGCRKKRTMPFLKDFFGPFFPTRFANLAEERRSRRP